LWLAALFPGLAAGFVYFRAATAERQAARDVAADSRLSFTLANLDRPALSGVEPVAAAPGFHDLIEFNGRMYVSSAGGLEVYADGMSPAASWRPGMELPAAEMGAITTAVLRGSGARELLIATNGAGLLRFDGSRFRQLLPNRPELRRVTALLALPTGRILFGTETAGVAVYDGETLQMLDPLLASEHITSMAGTDQDLWIGTLLHGAWHLHAGRMERIESDLPDPQVLSLAVHGDRAYIGTPLGVVEFQGGAKRRTLANGTFALALAANAESLSIGTQDEGLFEVPLEHATHTGNAPTMPPAEPIERIVQINGATYSLTPTAIFRKSATQWEKITAAPKNVLTDRHISALSIGTAGDLWAGYFDRGLDILSGNRETLSHFEDDHLFCVNRIAAGSGARTAVATANGLVMFGGNAVRQVLTRKDGLIADHVTDVAFHEDGLVAATPSGISFVDNAGVRSVYVFQGLVNNHVYALGLAGDRLLAGTLGGVSVLDHEIIRASYTTANSGLKHNWVTALVRVGNEWFAGTYGAGILRLDAEGVWHTFPDLDSRFVVNPGAMLLVNGRVYAGSLDRGLYVYDVNSARWRNSTAGLPSLNVTAFASAGDGIYVGTDNGAVHFEELALP
jgi:ligand-binding sensor domain-containing protein